jgi:histone-lysine N-methyltransferase SETMAR
VIFYYCRQGEGGKKIHYKLSDVYGKDSYSLSAVKYWVCEFKAQKTGLHDEIRPRRPLIDVFAQIARILNDEPFGSTCHLARQLAVTKEVVKRNLQEVLGFHKFGLKWVPNVLSAEQKAARVQMSCEFYNNLIFERQKDFATEITRDESQYYRSYAEWSMWRPSRGDIPTRPFQKIDSKKSLFTIFFSGEKLAFLDSLPKGQNMDPYYSCNTVLEGVKVSPFAGTRKETLRDVHIYMDNCNVHNPKLTKGKLDKIRFIRRDHSPYSPDIAPSDFWVLGQRRDEGRGLL